ncbi:MAG: hypothetical protein EOL97_14155 [Spirochaetia bacterium]|nr:hypothetical protein [Spirochaetia bacterium]
MENVTMSKDRISYRELYELIDKQNGIMNNHMQNVYSKIDNMNTKVDFLTEKTEKIHVQVVRTNGRVDGCENWQNQMDKIVDEIKKKNIEQDNSDNKTKEDVWKMRLRIAQIVALVIFIFYLTTGILLPIF